MPNIEQLEDADSTDPAKLQALFAYYREKIEQKLDEMTKAREVGQLREVVLERFVYHSELLARVVDSLHRTGVVKVTL